MRDVNIEFIRSVNRAIDVLDSFSTEKPELSIDEIVAQTKIAKTTVYRLLYTLEKRGLVRYNRENFKYQLGLKLLEYGSLISSTLDVKKDAEDTLNELQRKIQQTVLMAIYENEAMVYVYKRENSEGLKFSPSYVGKHRPLHYGVLSQVILAYLPEYKIDKILRDELPQWTEKTIVDKNKLRERLKQIRQDQYCIDVEETAIGVTGVGAPVFDRDGNFISVVGVIGPSILLVNEELDRVLNLLQEAAREISLKVGYNPKVFQQW